MELNCKLLEDFFIWKKEKRYSFIYLFICGIKMFTAIRKKKKN